MNWTVRLSSIGALAFALAACDSPAPSAPTASLDDALFQKVGAPCSVDVGTTNHPLFALHELEGWLNDALNAGGSSLNCGQTRSLDAKMEAITKHLDRTPPNWHAACGESGALVNELTALVNRGQLATPSFPPPFPGGPTNVVAAAEDLHERWCAAARGELVGPRS